METRKTEKLDVTKYVGTKVKIVKADYMDSKHGETIFLQTESIPLIDDDTLPNNAELTGTLFLSLMKGKEDGVIHIGNDTKAEKFLLAKKIDITKLPDFEVGVSIKNLIGLEVVVQKNNIGFLTIA